MREPKLPDYFTMIWAAHPSRRRAVCTWIGPGADPADRIVAVTQPGDNNLRQLAARFGLSVLDHPPDVGGRFSVLTVSGLLPAMIAGLDGAAVRAGALQIVDSLDCAEARNFPPAAAAALAFELARKGRTQCVLMPYSDRLQPLALWWRQLWASRAEV